MQRSSGNIHHKNLQKISTYLDSWLRAHLAGLGVIEVGYSYYNLKKNHYLVASSNNPWRDQFVELELERALIPLLQAGTLLLPELSPIQQAYQHYGLYGSKTLFVFHHTDGFEVFGVTTLQDLSPRQYPFIKRALSNLSYELYRYKKPKASLYTRIRDLEHVQAQHRQHTPPAPIHYQKARFNGEIILTAKEQQYIEYILFNLTHKEIAYKHRCSEVAVRKILINIKRKLGEATMPTSHMMRELKKRGVLALLSETLA